MEKNDFAEISEKTFARSSKQLCRKLKRDEQYCKKF